MPDDYPPTLRIADAIYHVGVDPAGPADYAVGAVYVYDAQAGPGLARAIRVVLARCPSCGSTLRSGDRGELTCTARACGVRWFAVRVAEPGRSPVLAFTDQRP